MSEIFSLPSQEKISQAELRQCSDDTRCKSLLPTMPPSDELEDLYHYLSNNDELVCIRDLKYFVASDALKTLAATCQELRRSNRIIRNDLQSIMCGESGEIISMQDLKEYVDKLFNDLSEGELTHIYPLLCCKKARQ